MVLNSMTNLLPSHSRKTRKQLPLAALKAQEMKGDEEIQEATVCLASSKEIFFFLFFLTEISSS